MKADEVNGKFTSWSKELAFSGLVWIHTKNFKVTGPAGSVVGKSTYKDLKHLNWDNHDEPYNFRGCTTGRKWIQCWGKWVLMEFDIPPSLLPDNKNDMTPEIENQAILRVISIRNKPWTLDALPENVQAYIKEHGN